MIFIRRFAVMWDTPQSASRSSTTRTPCPSNWAIRCRTLKQFGLGRRRSIVIVVAMIVLLTVSGGDNAIAQDQLIPLGGAKDLLAPSEAPSVIGGRYVHDDSIGFLSLSPSHWWDNDMFRLYPTEILRVQAKETIGIDPDDIRDVQATFGLSFETGQPLFSAVVQLAGKVDGKVLKEALDLDPRPIKVGEHTAVRVNGSVPMVLSRLESNAKFGDGEEGEIWYIGSPDWLIETAAAQAKVDESERGPLPIRLASLPKRDGISAVVEMKTIRPIVSGFAMNAATQLPHRLQPLGQIPGLTDAVLLHVDLKGEAVSLDLTLVGIDESAAEQIEGILKDSLIEAQTLAMTSIQQNLEQSDMSPAMREAVQSYAARISAMVLQSVQPLRIERDVTIQTESELSVASTGVLVGLLLPAVQAGRQAARRMQSSNNVKQIMLAIHNHHAAYNQLPLSAIGDDEGNPLLSWRVKLLPFLDEMELYQRFHLDEPWDSEHNLQVAQQIPAVYESIGLQVQPGHTIYQAVVGEDIGMRPMQETRFRDFLDGLSNSILVLEADADEAVFWTQPKDITIDLNNPLNGLGHARTGGFHVGMGDGAVKFITENIDPQLFRKLLTRAGKEPVDIP
ncbi:DUF1559 domain-containing protein [Rhodopirellula baltica]|nr:DUF1559 domain-containing protein [Rhodopirellula baltica]